MRAAAKTSSWRAAGAVVRWPCHVLLSVAAPVPHPHRYRNPHLRPHPPPYRHPPYLLHSFDLTTDKTELISQPWKATQEHKFPHDPSVLLVNPNDPQLRQALGRRPTVRPQLHPLRRRCFLRIRRTLRCLTIDILITKRGSNKRALHLTCTTALCQRPRRRSLSYRPIFLTSPFALFHPTHSRPDLILLR